jgi:hypothetical protein
MFAAGRRFFLGSHGTLVAVSAPFMMPLRDSDIPMNFSFTFCNKQPFTPKVSCGPFPALTIALLVSASGFDTCVHTHGASMKLVDGFPVKLKGSDTAPTAHSAALVCCIGEGRMIWVWLGAAVSGCTCCLPCCVPSALYVCVFDVCVRELCTPPGSHGSWIVRVCAGQLRPRRAPHAFATFRLATIYLPQCLLLKWGVVTAALDVF